MAVVSRAGLQVPVILLVEIVGKSDSESPEQIGSTWVNAGMTIEFTTMVMVVVGAQGSDVGVNVYSVVVVLFIDGFHVPVIPLVEVIGKDANESPVQIGFT